MTNKALIDYNSEDSNTSSNPTFDEILNQRLMSRRGLLKTGASAAAIGSIGLSLTACGSDDNTANTPSNSETQPLKSLEFRTVPKSVVDKVSVPEGYSYSVIVALGDPIIAGTAAYKNDGTDTDFDKRSGDHHDGMEWFGLSVEGKPSASSIDRGLLAINHEATTNEWDGNAPSHFIHADGGTKGMRPASEVDKEVDIHGLSISEVKKTAGKWSLVKDSALNFRITGLTEMELAGPARGKSFMVSKFSPDGTMCRGTLNNCGTGKTPWDTFLTGEENWYGYFFRDAADDAARSNDKTSIALRRYGMKAGQKSRHGWESGGSADKYMRWNNSVIASSATGDYRNEANTFGYIVEMDAYNKTRKLKKRTALGRFAHESASFAKPVAGKPLEVYMGDDSRNEYMYKFTSTALWNPADATVVDRLAVGDKYLNDGKLYVAKFNANGTGTWVELTINNSAIKNYAGYAFADQADVCVHARLAGDAVGATKMDRPEWGGINPSTGEFYMTLTNNSRRVVEPPIPVTEQDKDASLQNADKRVTPDGANPRVYTDVDGIKNSGNVHGHILRLKEVAGTSSFNWDIYLFGAEADSDTSTINLSRLTDDQDFSAPDGLVFSPNTGICWIQTDDGAYTDTTNCMMLAAIPGNIGDGSIKTLSYDKTDGSKLNVVTPVGAVPTADKLKRFLVGARDCEITGFCETPDGKAIFINIQHPGETTLLADVTNPAKYTSQWPSNMGYGSGKRPRSATIVITKDDGGRIGT